uniref:Uncharacterized protein n=1 Tax=Candidatus Nitrotoga fabula TaxID=2182327 RepID=A0A2X0QVZ9_9PROT|nr:protein of unknown function [Candidatus Nitrotoga fabula]
MTDSGFHGTMAIEKGGMGRQCCRSAAYRHIAEIRSSIKWGFDLLLGADVHTFQPSNLLRSNLWPLRLFKQFIIPKAKSKQKKRSLHLTRDNPMQVEAARFSTFKT